MKIGFVCTNFNNASHTRAAIASLHAGGRWSDLRTVVVDNASHVEDVASLRELAREFPGMELVLSPENVGYFPGLNLGIGHLRTRYPDLEHFVVGNNDLVFPPNFVDVVERHRELLERWAVVAPDLVTTDGVHQNPHVLQPISWARRLMWNLYFVSYGLAVVIKYAARVTRRFTVRPENAPNSDLHKTPGPIEQGYGACYLLGPMFFRHFSRLCAPTFLMQEEYFLFEQLKSIGQMTYYDPRFVVLHQGHATMDRLPSRRHWSISRESHRTYSHFRAMSPDEQLRLIVAGSREAR